MNIPADFLKINDLSNTHALYSEASDLLGFKKSQIQILYKGIKIPSGKENHLNIPIPEIGYDYGDSFQFQKLENQMPHKIKIIYQNRQKDLNLILKLDGKMLSREIVDSDLKQIISKLIHTSSENIEKRDPENDTQVFALNNLSLYEITFFDFREVSKETEYYCLEDNSTLKNLKTIVAKRHQLRPEQIEYFPTDYENNLKDMLSCDQIYQFRFLNNKDQNKSKDSSKNEMLTVNIKFGLDHSDIELKLPFTSTFGQLREKIIKKKKCNHCFGIVIENEYISNARKLAHFIVSPDSINKVTTVHSNKSCDIFNFVSKESKKNKSKAKNKSDDDNEKEKEKEKESRKNKSKAKNKGDDDDEKKSRKSKSKTKNNTNDEQNENIKNQNNKAKVTNKKGDDVKEGEGLNRKKRNKKKKDYKNFTCLLPLNIKYDDVIKKIFKKNYFKVLTVNGEKFDEIKKVDPCEKILFEDDLIECFYEVSKEKQIRSIKIKSSSTIKEFLDKIDLKTSKMVIVKNENEIPFWKKIYGCSNSEEKPFKIEKITQPIRIFELVGNEFKERTDLKNVSSLQKQYFVYSDFIQLNDKDNILHCHPTDNKLYIVKRDKEESSAKAIYFTSYAHEIKYNSEYSPLNFIRVYFGITDDNFELDLILPDKAPVPLPLLFSPFCLPDQSRIIVKFYENEDTFKQLFNYQNITKLIQYEEKTTVGEIREVLQEEFRIVGYHSSLISFFFAESQIQIKDSSMKLKELLKSNFINPKANVKLDINKDELVNYKLVNINMPKKRSFYFKKDVTISDVIKHLKKFNYPVSKILGNDKKELKGGIPDTDLKVVFKQIKVKFPPFGQNDIDHFKKATKVERVISKFKNKEKLKDLNLGVYYPDTNVCLGKDQVLSQSSIYNLYRFVNLQFKCSYLKNKKFIFSYNETSTIDEIKESLSPFVKDDFTISFTPDLSSQTLEQLITKEKITKITVNITKKSLPQKASEIISKKKKKSSKAENKSEKAQNKQNSKGQKSSSGISNEPSAEDDVSGSERSDNKSSSDHHKGNDKIDNKSSSEEKIDEIENSKIEGIEEIKHNSKDSDEEKVDEIEEGMKDSDEEKVDEIEEGTKDADEEKVEEIEQDANDDNDKDQMVKYTFRFSEGDQIELTLEAGITVSKTKEIIADYMNKHRDDDDDDDLEPDVEASSIDILFAGKTLRSKMTLESLNLEEGEALSVFVRKTADIFLMTAKALRFTKEDLERAAQEEYEYEYAYEEEDEEEDDEDNDDDDDDDDDD